MVQFFSFDLLLKRFNSAPLQPVDISFNLDLLIVNDIFIWCILKSNWGFKPESNDDLREAIFLKLLPS